MIFIMISRKQKEFRINFINYKPEKVNLLIGSNEEMKLTKQNYQKKIEKNHHNKEKGNFEQILQI